MTIAVWKIPDVDGEIRQVFEKAEKGLMRFHGFCLA